MAGEVGSSSMAGIFSIAQMPSNVSYYMKDIVVSLQSGVDTIAYAHDEQ